MRTLRSHNAAGRLCHDVINYFGSVLGPTILLAATVVFIPYHLIAVDQ